MLIDELKGFVDLPEDIRITTSDAVPMYTNIDPEEGVNTVEKYLYKFRLEVEGFVLVPLLVKLLQLV